MEFKYQSGFGNYFFSEALAGSLPKEQNSPQIAPKGLYAEQLTGSAFTAPRAQNLYSWLYRVFPSVKHSPFEKLESLTQTTFLKPKHINPNQMRWNSLPQLKKPTDFIEGIQTVCGAGSPDSVHGLRVHLYRANKNMKDRYFMNADGDFLILPQSGQLLIKTELGFMTLEPTEMAVIPRGMKWQIELLDKEASGYICENFGAPFKLPDLGPIGANGLAHPRHFLTPTAAFEDKTGDFELIGKFANELWTCKIDHSPLDVVAWHGNYAPYKYDLKLFNTINTVSFDHPDPSIFTVLTSPTDTAGVANVDFVIFPPRWMVAENTFRPPYFHRNCMSEYMGLIHGEYDAKTGGGFIPGGGSLHNFYSAHGPDNETFEKASSADLKPQKIKDTLAFMFETRYPYYVTDLALTDGFLQKDYQNCWQGFKKNFKN